MMCMGRRLGAREIRASLEFEGGDLVGDLSKYGVWNLVDMAQSLVAKCQHRTFGIHIILQSTNTSSQIQTLSMASLSVRIVTGTQIFGVSDQVSLSCSMARLP